MVTAFFWGTMPVAGKVVLLGASPFFVTFVRFLTAGLLLAVALVLFRRREELHLLRKPPWLLLAATLGLVGNYVLYIVGLQYTTATAAQFIIQTGTVFLVAWSALFLKERLTARRVAGMALAITGVLIVSWNGQSLDVLVGSDIFVGNLIIVASALCWSLYAVLQKGLGRRYTSYATLIVVYFAGALITSPGALILPTEATWVVWVALAYLCLNTLLAYGAFAESLQHVDASTTSVIVTFAPLVTVVLVALLAPLAPHLYAGEITRYTLAGGALILAGILTVIRER